MFGTLRYGSQEDDSHFIPGPPGTDSGVPGPSPRYSACDQCRGKKVILCLHTHNRRLMICRTCSNAAAVKEMVASDADELRALAHTPKMAGLKEAEKIPATPAMVVRPTALMLLRLLRHLRSEVTPLIDNGRV